MEIQFKQKFFAGLLAIAAVFITTVVYAADLSPSVKAADEQLLAGRWLRTEGDYILELSQIKKDGGLKAVYLNPRSINVSRAEWKRSEGKINIFVELRDVNYPGSQYTLQYNSASDRLLGTYFHAGLKQTFEVEFLRVK